MIATISLGTCISVQGDLVSHLPCGDLLVKVGAQTYRGPRIGPRHSAAERQRVDTEEQRAY